jgi:hypothetical protein
MLVKEIVNLRENNYKDIEFEIHTVAVIENSIFWDIIPSSPLKINHLGFFLHTLKSEYGGNMFL